MSLTEHKGGLLKLTANEGGRGRESSQYYRTSWRDNLNFIVPQAKSSNPPPPSYPSLNPPPSNSLKLTAGKCVVVSRENYDSDLGRYSVMRGEMPHWWPRQNFSLQYQYIVKQTSHENKEKYQLGVSLVDPIPNSQNSHHYNCMGELLIRSW